MPIGTYISTIILNVSGLNTPTKRHRLAELIHTHTRKTHIYAVYKRHTSPMVNSSQCMAKPIQYCKVKQINK